MASGSLDYHCCKTAKPCVWLAVLVIRGGDVHTGCHCRTSVGSTRIRSMGCSCTCVGRPAACAEFGGSCSGDLLRIAGNDARRIAHQHCWLLSGYYSSLPFMFNLPLNLEQRRYGRCSLGSLCSPLLLPCCPSSSTSGVLPISVIQYFQGSCSGAYASSPRRSYSLVF